MIVVSLLLALGAVALLIIGLAGGNGPSLIGAVAASLLAATALVAGGRRPDGGRAAGGSQRAGGAGSGPLGDGSGPLAGLRPAGGVGIDGLDHADDHAGDGDGNPGGPAGRENLGGLEAAADLDVPAAVGDPDALGDAHALGDADEEEPPDEPVAQRVSAPDAARLAGMGDEVFVVDGRPRYHRLGCVHLLTRTGERLPVREAVELGFTPCGLCEPASALLAGRSRG